MIDPIRREQLEIRDDLALSESHIVSANRLIANQLIHGRPITYNAGFMDESEINSLCESLNTAGWSTEMRGFVIYIT